MKIQYAMFFASVVLSLDVYASKPLINLTFVFAVEPSKINEKQYNQIARQEIQVLNQYFIGQDGKEIFNFKLKNHVDYKSFKNMKCELSETLNKKAVINSEKVKTQFNQCFKNPNSVYVFIYDAYAPSTGWGDATSWGFNNNHRPFVLLDWKRLNYNQQAALPHEMGHAFGLRHVCISKAQRQDSTNIMASAGNCDGSGGKRNIGFNPNQLNIILEHYRKLSSN